MFRNWILQDFSHAFPPRSLQAIGTTSFHTSHMKNRGFWNIFEFSRKPDNSKDAKKLSVDESSISDRDTTSRRLDRDDKSNDDTSKDVITLPRTVMTNSNKVYSYNGVPRCNYAFRYVPRLKSKRKNSKTNFHKYDGLTSLLDGDLVSTNMKLKLKDYKTLRNVRAEELAFVPGDRSFELDVMPTKSEMEKIPNELSKGTVSTDVTNLKKVASNPTKDHDDMESYVLSQSEKNLSVNDINPEENDRSRMLRGTSKEAQDTSYNIASLKENNETTNEFVECSYRSERAPERIASNRIVTSEIREDASTLRRSWDMDRDEYGYEKVRLKSDVKSINNRSDDEVSLKRNDSSYDHSRNPTNVTSNLTILRRKRGKTDAVSGGAAAVVASSPSYGMTFRKANDNSTNQRWSGFDRGSAVNRCYTVGNSRSHVSGSRGSTYPYSPTLQTREASSKCYNVAKDPIVRSNIIGSASRILKTRNSVTGSIGGGGGGGADGGGYMTNINNPKQYSNVNTTNRIFLGSKSSTGIAKAQQTFAYGCCKKPKPKCCPKKRKDTCDEPMIPGKVICTKPQRKSCCPKPKCCQPVEKKPCPPEVPPLRPSCCPKPKKKKICKRYCCPSLKDTDCFASRGTCPGQCVKEFKSDYPQEDDPSCLPPKEEMSSCQRKSDCCDDDDNNNNNNNCESDCNASRSMCTSPKKCTRSFNCMDSDLSCLEKIQSRRGICKKRKKKDCCKRNSRRSKSSCGNRRYHSGTTKARRTKSYVNIPLFDVSVVSYRPYQNDAVLRFYSSCENDRKQKDSMTTNKDCCDDKSKEMVTCAVKKTDEILCKSKTDLPGGKDRKEIYQVRWERELREIQKCKDIGKKEESCKSNKCEDLDNNVIGSCHKDKCDKFVSIDSTTTRDDDDDRYPRSFSNNQIVHSFDMPFGILPIGTSLLNFGMRSNSVIPNRSFSMTKITMDIQREELPILVENESTDKEWADEESSSE